MFVLIVLARIETSSCQIFKGKDKRKTKIMKTPLLRSDCPSAEIELISHQLGILFSSPIFLHFNGSLMYSKWIIYWRKKGSKREKKVGKQRCYERLFVRHEQLDIHEPQHLRYARKQEATWRTWDRQPQSNNPVRQPNHVLIAESIHTKCMQHDCIERVIWSLSK